MRALGMLSLMLLATGCPGVVSAIEVLPPRTSATCTAPGVNSAAYGRGLLDVEGTRTLHGAYFADLRISSFQDMVVDALSLDIDYLGKSETGLELPVGNVFLTGADDELRVAVLENVELLPRDIAVELRDDSDATDIEFETVQVTITALRGEQALMGEAGSFALDVCKGCLVEEPAEEDCGDAGIAETGACREGQDVPLYGCASGGGGLF